MTPSSGEQSSREAGMARTPEDVTLNTTAFGIIVAAVAAALLVVYAMLTGMHLIPADVLTQTAAHLAF
jgi:hypothetical protein